MASTNQRGSGGFWDWLAKNSDRVRAGVESKRVTSDIAREFDKSYPGLVWEITPRDDGGGRRRRRGLLLRRLRARRLVDAGHLLEEVEHRPDLPADRIVGLLAVGGLPRLELVARLRQERDRVAHRLLALDGTEVGVHRGALERLRLLEDLPRVREARLLGGESECRGEREERRCAEDPSRSHRVMLPDGLPERKGTGARIAAAVGRGELTR